MSHTPKPWVVIEHPNTWEVYSDGGETEISREVEGRTNTEIVANAFLIAASPDLLEAAEGLSSFIEVLDSGQSVLPYGTAPRLFDDAVEKLRAAISKARGEEVPA